MSEVPPSELDQTLAEPPGTRVAPTAAPTQPLEAAAPLGLPDVPGHTILKELGRGGMGVVYLARQEQLKRLVALKMILSGSLAGAEEVARFRREAESAARLQHPHIVQVHEIGECNGLPFFSLEFVEGGSLAARLDGKPVPPHEAAALVECLARAVHHAHQHGIIHRDLKPANILLAFSDASQKRAAPQRFCEASLNERVPKITDFGLAKQLDDSSQTRSGTIVGTPSYMAPEQARGDGPSVGTAADVYALGAILYEMLSGRPPFKGSTVMETLEQVCQREPITPSRLQPGCPRDMETICLKCLQKEPEKRYGSALALAEDLARFRTGEPIVARPVGAGERLWKWARRRPAVASLALTLLLTALAGVALVAWKWRAADASRRIAENALSAEEAALRQEEAERRRAEDALEESRRSQYFTNIAFASQAWSLNDIGKAEELLNACLPELRRWEWNQLLRRCREGLLTVRAGGAPVHTVCYSSDGRLLAAGTGEPFAAKGRADIFVWDAQRFTTPTVLSGHKGAVTALAFLPGDRLVSAAVRLDFLGGATRGQFRPRGEVIVWDRKAGKPLLTLKDVYGSVALTGDGKRFATVAIDGTVQVREVDGGKVVQSFSRFDSVVTSVAISPDGRHVAAAGGWFDPRGDFGAEVRAWDARQNKLAWSLPLRRMEVHGLAFSPDGSRLAWGGSAGRVDVRDSASGRLLLPFVGHTGAVLSVAFDPNGKRLATTSSDNAAKLWDAETGLELFTFRGHAGKVIGLAFDPTGPRLATGGHDGLVKVWDAQAGPDRLTLRGHKQAVRHLCFTPAGQLATCSGATVRLWQPRAGKPPQVLACDAQRVAFSPDGKLMAAAIGKLVAADRPGAVEVWDVAAGRKVRTLEGHSCGVLSVAFSPDGNVLVSASGDPTQTPPAPGEVRLWSAHTGRRLHEFRPPIGMVTDLAFSPDGRTLALAGTGAEVLLWDVAGRKEVRRLAGHRGWVHSVAFSPDGRNLATGDSSGSLAVWDVSSPDTGRPLRRWRGHTGTVYSVAFSPDGRRLASASINLLAGGDVVKLWEPSTGREILALPGRLGVAFSPDGALLAAPGNGGLEAALEVRIWDGSPTEEVFTLRADEGRALCVAFSPDGRTLATGHNDRVIKLWDRASGRDLRTLRGHELQIVDVAFSPDGKRVASAGWDRTVRLWDVAAAKEIRSFPGGKEPMTGVAFSPDGKRLATCDGSGAIRVWRVEDGKELHSFEQGGWAWSVAWHPNGRRLASGGRDKTVKIWDTEGGDRPEVRPCPAAIMSLSWDRDGRRLAAALGTPANKVMIWEGAGRPRSFEGHTEAVLGTALSPDGRRLLSCGFDRTIRRWDVESGHSRTLTGHSDIVRKVAWSPDGRHFASASLDGTVKVWKATDSGR